MVVRSATQRRKRRSFGAERAALLSSPHPPLSPHAKTHSLVHADARTCLLNSHFQTHLLPRYSLHADSSEPQLQCRAAVHSIFIQYFLDFHGDVFTLFPFRFARRGSSLSINRMHAVSIFKILFSSLKYEL